MSSELELARRISALQAENDAIFTVLAALVASAGEQGITLTPEALTKKYELTRFENVASLTTTFIAKETN